MGLGGSDGTKSFKPANMFAISEDPPESSEVWMRRLTAATEADRKWSAENGITMQKTLPSDCKGSVDPVMWHIRINLCTGNQEMAKSTMKVMSHITQTPSRKHELTLDDGSFNPRVANFLTA